MDDPERSRNKANLAQVRAIVRGSTGPPPLSRDPSPGLAFVHSTDDLPDTAPRVVDLTALEQVQEADDRARVELRVAQLEWENAQLKAALRSVAELASHALG